MQACELKQIACLKETKTTEKYTKKVKKKNKKRTKINN